MKLYLVQVEIFDLYNENIIFDTSPYCNVYSSFEHAKKEGLQHFEKTINEIQESQSKTFCELLKEEEIDYIFDITQIDNLEYAENFDINYDSYPIEEYNKLEPTHKVYHLDYYGNILYIMYEYRYKNALVDTKKMIELYPEDLEEKASEKFKIGDIVKLKHDLEVTDKNMDDNTDRIYVVRWLPRKFKGEKYFENKYALISFYDTDYNKWGNKELFTWEYWEKDIEKYTGVIEKASEYDLLSKIVKGDIEITRNFWNEIKIGMTALDTKALKESSRNIPNDWKFYATELTPKRTGLKVSIYPEKNFLGSNVHIHKDLPRIRIANADNKYEDTFSVTLEENPRVIIGENKLLKEDYKNICNFIRKNLDILIEHFNSDNKFGDNELLNTLRENGSIN